MSRWSVRIGMGLALLVGVVAVLLYGGLARDDGFVPVPLPLAATDRLFDVGVVDANGDGVMDIYTSNHHFRQVLWLGDGKGGFRDVLGDWGLDQSRDFPLAELSFASPIPGGPGVYVFWRGTQFVIQTHRGAELGAWRGTMRVLDPVQVASSEGFEVHKTDFRAGERDGTELTFSAAGNARLVLVPSGQGLPLDFRFEGGIRPDQIFVGLGKVSPSTPQFSLAMRDRHGHAWADINDDGALDVFISRGGLGGTLMHLPPEARDALRDELLVTDGVGKFRDVTVAAGIEKRGCSGRHVTWVDVDGNGSLELFVNCYDRGVVTGDFHKQLYRRIGPMQFEEVAEAFGLGLPDQQIGSYVWFDVDADGDVDLLAFQDEGLFLYRNAGGHFVQELVKTLASDDVAKIGHSTESTWMFDGKIVVADFDGDGYHDAYMASMRGSWLLRNDRGRLIAVDPATVGLPRKSLTASWVDYDNDGYLDLHLVPQGLYRQGPARTFERTGLLEFDPKQYRAAIVNWLDFDNDGRMDVLLALNPVPGYKPWWKPGTQVARNSTWQLFAYRNGGPARRWLQVDLDGPAGNRQGIGAVISVKAGNESQSRVVGSADGSFFSQGHYRTYFGLNSSLKADDVRVMWPDGVMQEVGAVSTDQLLMIKRR